MTDADPATEQLVRTFESGQLGQAFQQASMLAQQNPQNVVAWRILGQVKQFQGLWSEARQCAIHALRTDPGDIGSILLLAGVHGALGQSAEAMARCDEALAREPGSAQALALKAAVLERIGRTGEALEAVESIEGPPPASAQATLVRALLREGRTEEALAAADSAIAREDVADHAKHNLLMLKAKALDRLGRFDEAIDAATRAKSSGKSTEVEPDRYVKRAHAVMQTYSSEKMAALPVSSSLSEHVFIAGFPRTGTTLVEQILDVHPQARGVGEAKEIDVFTRSLQQRTGAFVPFPGCAEFAEPALLDQLASAYERAMESHGFGAGVRYVDKNLQNLPLVGFIAQLFPRARFILTERDPRDVAVSCLLGQFRPESMPHLFDLDHLAASLKAAQELTTHWQAVLPGRTLLVRYEDLVRDHEAQTRRLVEFVGLPWDERCLRFYESERTVMTLAYDQVTKPIYDSSIGRHRNYAGRLGPVEKLAERDG
jgi:tetratricopeptide (TPR) repeat protein